MLLRNTRSWPALVSGLRETVHPISYGLSLVDAAHRQSAESVRSSIGRVARGTALRATRGARGTRQVDRQCERQPRHSISLQREPLPRLLSRLLVLLCA